MAELEGEALINGPWKNVTDLEESLCLDELDLVIKGIREREYRLFKMHAALKGIDLDDADGGDAKTRVEEIKERVAQRASGEGMHLTDEQREFLALGIDVETE